MVSDEESDPYPIPKLPLFSITPHLHKPSGTSTPPLQTAASVPFRWEELPGKPRPCTDLIIHPTRPERSFLDLPPRLATPESTATTTGTSSPSPTTVLDGPGDNLSKRLFNFSSSSFRFDTERRRWKGSFDSNCSGGGWSPNDDGGRKGSFVISRSFSSSSRVAGFFEDIKVGKMRKSKVIRSNFLSKIFKGFKQVVPWRKKPKMETFTH